MLTPDEVAEAGQYLRMLARSTGQVRTGMGAARQDVNVSITGGTRVEIKGVAHIQWIPELVHNEAFRQKALLMIRDKLQARVGDVSKWQPKACDISEDVITPFLAGKVEAGEHVMAVALPGFEGLLSFFTSPGRVFADEIADRLKVVACLEKPNCATSEDLSSMLEPIDRAMLDAKFGGAPWLVFWGPERDVKTALDTVEERCRMAFDGVPNETRKSLPDGTTLFERVLPGADRMYPDTDSAPIPIGDDQIEALRADLPEDVSERMAQMTAWDVPRDCFQYLLIRSNRYPMLAELVERTAIPPRRIATLMAHNVKHAEGFFDPNVMPDGLLADLFQFVEDAGLDDALLKHLLPLAVKHPEKTAQEIVDLLGFKPVPAEEILAQIPKLRQAFELDHTSPREDAAVDFIMGELRPLAVGNMNLADLRQAVEGGRS